MKGEKKKYSRRVSGRLQRYQRIGRRQNYFSLLPTAGKVNVSWGELSAVSSANWGRSGLDGERRLGFCLIT